MNKLIFIFIIFFTSCITIDKPNESNNVESIKTQSIKIDGFLFVKKGMLLKDVVTYLDSKSIKHSELIKSDNMVDIINYENTKYIDVFNYQIEDIIIDKFRIKFIEDHVYQIKYDKILGVSQVGNENNEDKIWNFYNNNYKIISSIFYGLEQKYGYRGGDNGNVSPVTGFSNDVKQKECNEFEVEWNEENDSTHLKTSISIRLGNRFCYKIIKEPVPFHNINYYQYFDVHFFDKFIYNKIQENFKNNENKEKIELKKRVDSINKRRSKIVEQL
jgi:hypothetical protein